MPQVKVTVSRCVLCPTPPLKTCATPPLPPSLPPLTLPLSLPPGSLIQQRDLAVVTVVATHLAVVSVQVGGVGEGGRERVIVRGGVGVAGRGQQRLGVRPGRGRGRVVVLVLAGGGPAAVAQRLPLSQLVAERRHSFLLLQTQRESREVVAELSGL